MTTTNLDEAARRLDGAQQGGTAIDQFGDGLNLRDAYAVQARLLQLREGRGEQQTGRKLGFTSEAKMAQMGVSELIVGFLTDAMEIPNKGVLDLAGLVHPRVEPEVAFRLGANLPAGASEADLLAAIDAVAPALEIIDSRYRDFRFSLPDVVADNTSACRYVIGEWQAPGTTLAERAVTLIIDDTAVEHGSTSDILGDPLRTIPRLAAMSAKYGFGFRAGSVILAGAATAAVALMPDTRITAAVEGLGTVTFETKGSPDTRGGESA